MDKRIPKPDREYVPPAGTDIGTVAELTHGAFLSPGSDGSKGASMTS